MNITLTQKHIDLAKKAYEASIANHPTIHCNRFPNWDELTYAQRNEWITRVRTTSVTSATNIAG